MAVETKKSQKTPQALLEVCRRRLARYDRDQEE
jgi:phage-related protein